MNDDRRTPPEVFEPLNRIFQFTLDPCTDSENHLGLSKFYTKEQDGLKQSWAGEKVFCNPPYSRGSIMPWEGKSYTETDAFTCLLVPNDSSTEWWQFADSISWGRWNIEFRVKFLVKRNGIWVQIGRASCRERV